MKSNPKRRKNKDNPYTIVFLENENKYFIRFENEENVAICIPIEKEIFEIFNEYELIELSQMNRYDRHIEHSELSEITLNKKMINKPESVENIVCDIVEKERLYNAVLSLPESQKRRILMYYFGNYTQKEIADKEKCSIRAIQYSLKIGLKNLKKFLI